MSLRRHGREREAGGGAFNTLATCVIITILLSTGMTYYFRVIRLAREVALQYELANIRTAIVLFTTINRRFPQSIKELVDNEYLLPEEEFAVAAGPVSLEKRTIFKRRYLEASSVDAQGRVLDPYGQPYGYDPQRGLVTVAEKRHGHW